jgi:hypothetical protein
MRQMSARRNAVLASQSAKVASAHTTLCDGQAFMDSTRADRYLAYDVFDELERSIRYRAAPVMASMRKWTSPAVVVPGCRPLV